ncbi:MAG: trigger factor [Bacillota bacterium]|nr:trigger factor [Bacillota bacterium]
MSSKLETIEKNVVQLEVTVEADKFNLALKKSFNKNSKKFNVPGFRKGKAPMNIIKKFYGEGVFYEDAINFVIDDTYTDVIKENNIKPVDYPELDVKQIEEGKEFVYTAKVTVKPEVELGEYKGVEVKKVEYPVTDEEIDAQIKELQEKNGRTETKTEGAIEKGDIAVIDFVGYVDGVAFEGGQAKDYSLEIGSASFVDTFEEQLIGLKAGDSKNINVTFPDEYGNESLNGKPAVFEVTVNSIKIKELPKIDDEFAKEASEFDTLDELKADFRKKLEEANSQKAKKEFEESIIDTVCNNATIDIPEVMFKNETDNMLKDLEYRLKYQGLDLKSYYQYTNSSEDKVREYMKESAEKKVKTELVFEKIAEVEKIEAIDEELNAKAYELAKQYGEKDVEKNAEFLLKAQKETLKLEVINEKIIKLLVESSKVIA